MFGGMGKIEVILPDDLRDWVEAQVAAGDYGDVSEVVRDLIEQERHLRQRIEAIPPRGPSFSSAEELKALLQEGLDSGDAGPADEVLGRIRADLGLTGQG